VVGRGNDSGGASYGVYPCYNKSLGMQLSNIFYKIRKITYLKIVICIIKMMYCFASCVASSPRDLAMYCSFGHLDFGGTNRMR
jgi:hypothetical protein